MAKSEKKKSKKLEKTVPGKTTGGKTASGKTTSGKTTGVGSAPLTGKAKVASSETVYTSRVFWVTADKLVEPGGVAVERDVIRHNGSAVMLAVDNKKNKGGWGPKDPGILLIRQYRHAAGKFLLELPAGRLEPGEKLLAAGKRELIEETGFRARRWSRHARYFASPGFLSEAMNILLAEDLTPGIATPEEDEKIELRMTPLSEVMRMIFAGEIEDGKTLIGVLLYAAQRDAAQKHRTRKFGKRLKE